MYICIYDTYTTSLYTQLWLFFLFFFFFFFFALIFFHLCIQFVEVRVGCMMYVCYSLHCTSIRQLAEVSSLLSPCKSKRLNSGGQPWWKAPIRITSLILSGLLFFVVLLENIGLSYIPYTQISNINQSLYQSILSTNEPPNVTRLLPPMKLTY
jgi:hypothetical protein